MDFVSNTQDSMKSEKKKEITIYSSVDLSKSFICFIKIIIHAHARFSRIQKNSNELEAPFKWTVIRMVVLINYKINKQGLPDLKKQIAINENQTTSTEQWEIFFLLAGGRENQIYVFFE